MDIVDKNTIFESINTLCHASKNDLTFFHNSKYLNVLHLGFIIELVLPPINLRNISLLLTLVNKSLKSLIEMQFDGYAIGGLAVGGGTSDTTVEEWTIAQNIKVITD